MTATNETNDIIIIISIKVVPQGQTEEASNFPNVLHTCQGKQIEPEWLKEMVKNVNGGELPEQVVFLDRRQS